MRQLLEQIGVDVDTADSGEQAVERARQRRPDIAFLDMRLPEMNGAETRERLEDEHGAAVKFACVTVSVFAHERQRLTELGFEKILDKPVRAEEVYGCLADQLGATFEYRDAAPSAAAEAPSWTSLTLPAELAESLAKAAEAQSVTELNRLIAAVAELGADGENLATHLRVLSRRFDMKAIREVLDSVETS